MNRRILMAIFREGFKLPWRVKGRGEPVFVGGVPERPPSTAIEVVIVGCICDILRRIDGSHTDRVGQEYGPFCRSFHPCGSRCVRGSVNSR